ncbi:hypothetical protein FPQ18DRAFT_125559 [Pyronema domesticum]|uniref:Similar to N-carbamoyl-L-amino acid hydrolase acc. no. Q53389 n=1 Tax=Pyronema omphalodes (strain CBS 100304) TaxID=1076935 RepID=U4LNK5_PYROM|nr:hypothetical protein FPQ18DRAFT_125559 [Pyronema domesticum]CCX16149.1 Similar to N-carbamoyl-L-amino acid hydrolase; acc. no. Q53389 [Pyronema omphalodes CBS 100304]
MQRFVPAFPNRLSGLTINSTRLWDTIHTSCQWGAAHRYGKNLTDTGMARLALSDDDSKVRAWFVSETKKLGCDVTIDNMGNIFALRKGKNGGPMTAIGSHLDTQPRGGRYDGILGVVAGLEALRTIHENGYETNYDVGIVNWTNEEGARFPKSMHASGVWAGVTPLEEAWNLADIMNPSITTKAELQRHGYLGELTCSSASYPLAAHFELHIEQGPILEGSNKKVGIVSGAQAYRWLTVTVDGRDAHTGTTPFNARKDPLLAAAKMVVHSNELAKERGALASTGVFKLPMGSSTNTLPAQVIFTLDIRHPSHGVVKEIYSKCIEGFNKIAMEDGKGVDVTIEVETDSPEIKFHPDCREAIRKAANGVVGEDGSMDIMSGAGHDSVYTSRICPTGMIFVQCKDGVSHHPTEYCSPEDCSIGAQTILDAVINYDKLRVEQGM